MILFDIPLDDDGLKYAYWSRGDSPLYAADTIEGLEPVLLQQSPALVISPMESKEALQKLLEGKLKYLFDGKLGKRECAVFKTEPTPPAPTGQSNRPRGLLQPFLEGGE